MIDLKKCKIENDGIWIPISELQRIEEEAKITMKQISVGYLCECLIETIENDTVSICRQRVTDHIDRVKHFYKLMWYNGIISKANYVPAIVERHDDDKLEPENLRRQSLRFKTDGCFTDEELKEIDDVVREHIKSNPHHCEYWGDGDHLAKGIVCYDMPDIFIYEMMADWAATCEEKGGMLKDWYNKNVGTRWIFSEHQKEIMLKCINFLSDNIDSSLKRDYGLKYIDPADVKRNN